MSDKKKPSLGRRASLLTVAILATASIAASLALKSPGAASHGTPLHFTAASTGPVSFNARLSQGAILQGSDGQIRIQLLLGADASRLEKRVRVPTDVLVVLDRSGSMEGTKIDYARSAVTELLTHLGPDDRFALVAYSSGAEIAIPLAPATEGAKPAWRRVTRSIRAVGGTNMSRGIDLALGILGRRESGRRAARVILLSDGLANEGDATFEGLTARALRAARQEYVLSAIGIGADFNEYLMSGLADAGTGNYYYLENTRSLASVFTRELEATRTTVATGVAVSIEPGTGVEVVDAAGYPLERDGGHVIFRPGSLFAGQEREIWVTLRVPAEKTGPHDLGEFALSYTDEGVRHTLPLRGTPRVACVPDRNEVMASVDKKAWEASVVEEEYNELQQNVARAVKDGDKEEAVREIHAYRKRNTELNAELGSARVDESLDALEALERDVNDAFTGPDQQRKQNLLSKERQAEAWDGRRAGSKK